MRAIQPGDFFLLPFKGTRRNLLVKAVRQVPGYQQWYVSNERGHETSVLLSSCRRCPPSVAQRILKTPNLSMSINSTHNADA
jgi:hypothetical protein